MMVDVPSAFPSKPSLNGEMQDRGNEKRFIVAIDFGTTFSSVSFHAVPKDGPIPGLDRLGPRNIESIVDYPDAPTDQIGNTRKDVPSESWYPSKTKDVELEDRRPNEHRNGNLVTNLNESPNQGSEGSDQELIPDFEESSDECDDELDEEMTGYAWGFGVQRRFEDPDSKRYQNRRIRRSKLLLDRSDLTKGIRDELRGTLRTLRNRRLIKKDEDIISDYLERLFRHTRVQLTKRHGFNHGSALEFVLCVPAMWKSKAVRKMQTAMEKAITKSGFGSVTNGSIEDLFIVSEPEAAAAFLLERTDSVEVNVQIDFVRIRRSANHFLVWRNLPCSRRRWRYSCKSSRLYTNS